MATTYIVPAPVQTQAVQVASQAPAARPATKFRKVFLGLGITLLTMGVLSIILGGVSLSPSMRGYAYYPGYGLWGGAWYVASGVLSLVNGVIPNRCNVIAGIVVSTFTSLVAFSVGSAEATLAGSGSRLCSGSYGHRNYSHFCTTFQGIHVTLALLGIASCILAIIHSSFCCCCGNSSGQTIAVGYTYFANDVGPTNTTQGGDAVVYQPQQIPASPPGYNPEQKQAM